METAVSKTEYGQVMASNYSNLFMVSKHNELQYIDLDDTRGIGWTSHTKEAFSTSGASNTTPGHHTADMLNVSYVVSSPHDVLHSSTMGITVPDLILKKEYAKDHRFKMAKYFGYAIAGKCELTSGTRFRCTLSTYDQIVLFEHLTSKGIKDGLARGMGEGGICSNWTQSIKSKTVYYPQQWGYSLVEAKEIQLWMLTEKLIHNYEFDLSIVNNINVQKFDDQIRKYVDVQPDMKMFEGDVKTFARPMLYGEFSNKTFEEKAIRAEENINTFYIYDMICCDADNPKSVSITSASFKSSVGLTQAIFFSLENITQPELNYICNYTTDTVPNDQSVSAIKSVTITTDTGIKVPMLPPELFLTPKGLKSNSTVPGIFVQMYVNRVGKGNNGGSLPQKNGTKLKCVVSPKVLGTSQVHLRARALVIKHVKITDGIMTTSTDDPVVN